MWVLRRRQVAVAAMTAVLSQVAGGWSHDINRLQVLIANDVAQALSLLGTVRCVKSRLDEPAATGSLHFV